MADRKKIVGRFVHKLQAYRRLIRPKIRKARLRVLSLFLRILPSESRRVFVLTLIVGASCGLAAVAFHLAIIKAESFLIEPALLAGDGKWVWLTILTPVLGGILSGWLLQYVVPGARGSGIPQVKVAYEVRGGGLPFREALGKFFISVLQIGSGASLGREGPTVHICAGIASTLGRTFALSRQNIKRLLPVGAAAGIAAAFNAPIAAVTFTIEEVVGDLDQTVLSGVIVAAAIAAAIERGILGEHPVLTVTGNYGLQNITSLVFFALLGVVAAFVSLAFTESLLKLRGWFKKLRFLPLWAQPAVGGLVTGLLAVVALYFFQTGGINGGGYESLTQALSGKLAFQVMAVLCLMKVAATVFSYSSGGAGGIFAPALFIGGMLGGVVGFVDVKLLGGSDTQLGAFALVGMGAAFAGIIRAPITSVLIIFEMTGSYGLILPLMIANMTSYGIARRFRPVPIYEALLDQDDIHLPHRPKQLAQTLEHLRVTDAMISKPLTVEAGATVAATVERIEGKEFTTYPVIDQRGRCTGVITEMRLRRNLAEGKGAMKVREFADKCHTISPDQPLAVAVLRMGQSEVRQLSVVERDEGRKFLGIVTMSDIVRVQAAAIGEERDIDRSVIPDLG